MSTGLLSHPGLAGPPVVPLEAIRNVAEGGVLLAAEREADAAVRHGGAWRERTVEPADAQVDLAGQLTGRGCPLSGVQAVRVGPRTGRGACGPGGLSARGRGRCWRPPGG